MRTAANAHRSAGLPTLSAALVAALQFACGGQVPGTDKQESEVVYGTRVHKMPLHSGVTNTSAPAGAHLNYYGGRVISNAQIVQVLYGTGSFFSQVSSTTSPSIATFYQGITNSAYFDWLTEFNTPTGTNQTVGRGSFRQQVQITPAAGNNGTTITDAQIQSELAAQINAGHLPAPTQDSGGNNNTYYAVFFPHGKTISQGGSNSCQAGGFCAYHGTIASVGGREVYYGVHPDMQAGSGCDSGCGTGTTFSNYCSVASHELVEAVTDAEVGIATVVGPPLAWYDTTNGEIGDICNAQQGTVVGSDGVTYTVQKEFSNIANDCIVSRAVAGNDFSVSVSPASASVTQGSTVSFTIGTATTSGSAQTVSLSVSGLPAGVTGAFSPTSVSSGQSSTLTLTASATATTGAKAFTVTGSAASGSHTAGGTVTVNASGGGGTVLTNGVAKTGLSGATGATQTFTLSVPSGQTSLVFSQSGGTGDSDMYVKFGSAPTLSTYDCRPYVNGNAETCSFTNPAAGTWYVMLNGYAAYSGVSLVGTYSGGGGGGSGITNGTFETGSLSGWTTTGSAAAVSGGHSGSFAARAGSTVATNGDSNIAQTFTVPSGKSQLSLWYKITCPDTLTYDWATITLKNNSTAVTTTVLAKTCTNGGTWVNVTSAVAAGTSYTLTLTSHDDNYAADPTFTLFDDVSLN